MTCPHSKSDAPPCETRKKISHFYSDEIEDDITAARALLQNYSGIAPEDVVPHIIAIRDKAWSIYPYPCIGRFRFLDLSISQHPLYPCIVKRLTDPTLNQTFLDIGCCFGQDVRSLAADGAPHENLYGTDLERGFIDLGYELFQDRDTLKSTFFIADALDESEDNPLNKLQGKIDIIYAGSFLHLFALQDQIALAHRMLKLLKPKKESMILGRQIANVKAQEFQHNLNKRGVIFIHNAESFKNMWEQIGQQAGVKLRANVELGFPSDWGKSEQKDKEFSNPDTRVMRFDVHRME